MRRLQIILLVCIAGMGSARAGDTTKLDSLGLLQKIRMYRAPVNRFTDGFYASPALKYEFRSSSLTEMNIGLKQNQQDRYEQQQGSGYRYLGFEADAFLKNEGKDALWGSASYQNGKRTAVKWSENSDYTTIFPYVMADTIGGDLSAEEYRFAGGYALKMNKTLLGISAKYRALMEYRAVDPRPKNVSSDLEIAVGASRALSTAYDLAMGLSFRKYSQDSKLKFFSELGAPLVFHMVGLGVDNKLLAGNKMETFYNGDGYGVQLHIVPKSKTGFFSSFSYNSFSFNKVITDLLSIPVSELRSKEFKGDLAYLVQGEKQYYGVKIEAFKGERNGIESKFDNRGQGNYVKISSNKNYKDDRKEFKLTGVYGIKKRSGLSYDFSADLGISDQETQYLDPQRSMQYAALTGGVQAELSTYYGRSLVSILAGGRASGNTKGTHYWPGIDLNSAVYNMLESNYAYFTSGYRQLKLGAGWDYQWNSKIGVSLKTNWVHTSFDREHKGSRFLLTGGVTF